MKNTMLAIAISLMSCIAASLATAQELNWKLTAGDQFGVEFEQQSVTHTTVDKRNTQIDSTTAITMDWIVKEIDDRKNAVIEQSLKSIRLSVGNPSVPEQILAFDTSENSKLSKDSATLLKQIQPLIGLKFVVTMSPRGEILAVKNPDETMTVLRELPGSLPLQDLFSESGIKDLLGAAAVVLPDTSLVAGESWSTEEPISNAFGDFNRIRKYTFALTENQNGQEIARFELKTNLEPKGQAADAQAGALISFSETGELRLDVGEGYFATSEIQSTTKTEKPYRESKIETTVENTNRMLVTPRPKNE